MQTESAPQWHQVEIALVGPDAANPYTDIDAWVIFTHDSGEQLRRPGFWDGGTTYRVRFASTQSDGEWQWSVQTSTPCFLMTVQPGMNARGPVGRDIDEGFEIGFLDLSEGRLTKINVEYFRYFDKIIETLINHGITPVLQPVFHGFGWKGLEVAGPVVPPQDCARYCRYLVARFGARPAIYLPCGDGAGTEPQVEAGGREIETWDAYGQPTGIHYQPHHRNDEHQEADWLDFQSCQTGHMGDHVPDRLATMWMHQPPKAIMNGEPSYEHNGRQRTAEGWWQGHEAWCNVCAGALMGVAYGAASLWQWRLHPEEPGHGDYFLAQGAGWKEALEFEGSFYVGLVGKILNECAETTPAWASHS